LSIRVARRLGFKACGVIRGCHSPGATHFQKCAAPRRVLHSRGFVLFVDRGCTIRYLTPSFPLSAGGEGEAEGRG